MKVMRCNHGPVDTILFLLHLHLDVPATLRWWDATGRGSTALGIRTIGPALAAIVEVRAATCRAAFARLSNADTGLRAVRHPVALGAILDSLLRLMESHVLKGRRERLAQGLTKDGWLTNFLLVQDRLGLDLHPCEGREGALGVG